MSEVLTFAPDAAMALGIASTAMPFARTPDEEAERWLRVLRSRGEAGAALQALGVSEAPLEPHGETDRETAGRATEDRGGATEDRGAEDEGDTVVRVSDEAARIASRRGAALIATCDLLLAVMDVYGACFDRVLEAHGTDREELLGALGEADERPSG